LSVSHYRVSGIIELWILHHTQHGIIDKSRTFFAERIDECLVNRTLGYTPALVR